MSVTTRRKKRKVRHEEVMEALRAGQFPDLSSKEQCKLLRTISRKNFAQEKYLDLMMLGTYVPFST